MHIKKIDNSMYVHPYIKRGDALIQWLNIIIPADKSLGFFRYSGASQESDPISLLGQGRITGNLTFVTLDNNPENRAKELIPFHYSENEKCLVFFKNKKGFFEFSDFYHSHSSKYPLLNLMTHESNGLNGLRSLEQLDEIKDHINQYDLLNNALARETAQIQKNEDLSSMRFGTIKNIAIYKDKGICLLHTQNPLMPSIGDRFIILSDKQLCLLHSYVPYVQEQTYSFKLIISPKRKREEETDKTEPSTKKSRIESTEITEIKKIEDAKAEISKVEVSNIKTLSSMDP